MNTFLAMNGYGFYIWSAYGAAAIVIVVEMLSLRARRKAVLLEARLAGPEDADDSAEVRR